MDKPWTSYGRAATGAGPLCEKQQVDRRILERTTGFEPATPTLAKELGSFTAVCLRSPWQVTEDSRAERPTADGDVRR
jgi:hypothetical protein